MIVYPSVPKHAEQVFRLENYTVQPDQIPKHFATPVPNLTLFVPAAARKLAAVNGFLGHGLRLYYYPK